MRIIFLLCLAASMCNAMEDRQPLTIDIPKYKQIKSSGNKKTQSFKLFQATIPKVVELSQNPREIVFVESKGAKTMLVYSFAPEKKKLTCTGQIDTDEAKGIAISGEKDEFLKDIEDIQSHDVNLVKYEKNIDRIVKIDSEYFLILFRNSKIIGISDAKGNFSASFKLNSHLRCGSDVTIYDNGDFAILQHEDLQKSILYLGKRRLPKKMIVEKKEKKHERDL